MSKLLVLLAFFVGSSASAVSFSIQSTYYNISEAQPVEVARVFSLNAYTDQLKISFTDACEAPLVQIAVNVWKAQCSVQDKNTEIIYDGRIRETDGNFALFYTIQNVREQELNVGDVLVAVPQRLILEIEE